MIDNCASLSTYVPPPLIDWWGHVHTILNHIVREKKARLHSAIREILLLEDGGTVALDWLSKKPEHNSIKPIVILIHGLCRILLLSSSPHLR
jgi:predicted alpha/beta-fold hydrolase